MLYWVNKMENIKKLEQYIKEIHELVGRGDHGPEMNTKCIITAILDYKDEIRELQKENDELKEKPAITYTEDDTSIPLSELKHSDIPRGLDSNDIVYKPKDLPGMVYVGRGLYVPTPERDRELRKAYKDAMKKYEGRGRELLKDISAFGDSQVDELVDVDPEILAMVFPASETDEKIGPIYPTTPWISIETPADPGEEILVQSEDKNWGTQVLVWDAQWDPYGEAFTNWEDFVRVEKIIQWARLNNR